MTTNRRLHAGERAALGELYPSLRRFAAVSGPLDVDPDDLLAEALARTARHHQVTPTADSSDRLRRAILHAASAHRHRLGRERRALARLHATGDGVEAIYTDVAELLRLSPTVRALIFLRDIEAMEPRHIAAAVGTSIDAVVATTDRARRGLQERVGSPEAIAVAFERLAGRGRRPDLESVIAGAERRMSVPAPRQAPPERTTIPTRGWKNRRATFDRNIRSMAAGTAVAVFMLCAAVIAGLLLSLGGDEPSTSSTTRAAPGGVTATTVTVPASSRIVGWSGIGQVTGSARTISTTGDGFVAWGDGVISWSPDGATWEAVDGPASKAIISVAGDVVVALDPPSPEDGSRLWRSADGGRTWEATAGSVAAIPRIQGVIVTITSVQSAATDDVVLTAAGLRAELDWPALLDVPAERLSTGTVGERTVVWVEQPDGGERIGYRLDAVASGSQLTLRAIRVSDGEQAFELRGAGGVISTQQARTTLVTGGAIGTATWRSEDGGGFERGEELPIAADTGTLIGGNRFTLVTDGLSGAGSIWSSADGTDWEAVRTDRPFEGEALLDAHRSGDDWVAVTIGDGGISFWASVDGRFWFRADNGTNANALLADVTAASSGWVAAIGDGDTATVYWSSNGAEWAVQNVPSRDLLGAVATRSGVLAIDSAGAVWLGEIGT